MPPTAPNRWSVLAVLFAARLTMAFQFQSVAALSPRFMETFGVGLSETGLLIGLYLAPGLVIAMPGGAIARRFGDRRMIASGMLLMLLGALVMTLSATWPGQIGGRLLAGIGGVLLNVLMSKLVTDWFAGREIATAMGIFVNSWPLGIAAALLILPLAGGGESLAVAQTIVAVAVLLGLVLFLAGIPPADARPGTLPPAAPLRGRQFTAILLAGAVWGTYNGALGMVFGFGPALLVERGWGLAAASSATSIVLWLAAVSVPLGGWLADRTGRGDTVMVFGFLTSAALYLLVPGTGQVLVIFVLLGICVGLPAGRIMSLPAGILDPGNRAFGMGLFFTLFYCGVVFAPLVAGRLSDHAGTSAAAFGLGAALLLLCCGLLAALRWTAVRGSDGSAP